MSQICFYVSWFVLGVNDKAIAKSLLDVCQGNLEMAINMQMEDGGVVQGAAAPPPPPNNHGAKAIAAGDD